MPKGWLQTADARSQRPVLDIWDYGPLWVLNTRGYVLLGVPKKGHNLTTYHMVASGMVACQSPKS